MPSPPRSVPAAIVAAVTRGARAGILIRGGAFLEALAAVRPAAFDKTGTLTEGRPRLTDVVSMNGLGELDVLSLAAGVEAASEHPLAAAVLAGARERGVSWPTARDLQARPGVGVSATVAGQRLFVGRPDAISGGSHVAGALRAEGKTVVVVTRAGHANDDRTPEPGRLPAAGFDGRVEVGPNDQTPPAACRTSTASTATTSTSSAGDHRPPPRPLRNFTVSASDFYVFPRL